MSLPRYIELFDCVIFKVYGCINEYEIPDERVQRYR
jgi:hypothetical protein